MEVPRPRPHLTHRSLSVTAVAVALARCISGNSTTKKPWTLIGPPFLLTSACFWGAVYYNCLLSLPVVMMVVYSEGKLQEIRNFPDLGNVAFQVYFVASSVMGFVLTFAIVVCTQVNSALTTTVVGCIKNVLISYGGMIIGGDYIFSWMNFTGLNVSIGGSLYYSYIQVSGNCFTVVFLVIEAQGG